MRVGTAVIVVPLHHPLVIAEEIATLDLLAGGRVDIGLGRGYQHYEFERLRPRARQRPRAVGGVDRRHPEGVRGRALQLRRQALQDPGDDRSSRSRVQKPHPPIWVTAQSPESIEAAVRRGFNVLTGRLRRADRAHGRVPPALRSPGGGGQAAAAAQGRRAARGVRDGQRRPTRAPPPRRRAGTCA